MFCIIRKAINEDEAQDHDQAEAETGAGAEAEEGIKPRYFTALRPTAKCFVPAMETKTVTTAETEGEATKAKTTKNGAVVVKCHITTVPRPLRELPIFTNGMVFLCNARTFQECLRRFLLGLPRRFMGDVQRLRKNQSALFLYNIHCRRLFGVFVAASNGAEDIVPKAWSKTSRFTFPAQVRFRCVSTMRSRHWDDLQLAMPGFSKTRILTPTQVQQLILLLNDNK